MEYEIDKESLKEFNAESILINKENKRRNTCCGFNSKLHTYNWLEDFPEMQECTNLVEVQFKNTRKSFYINSTNIDLTQGDIVAVEALPGHDIGTVTLTGKLVLLQMKKTHFRPTENSLRRIYRIAREGDLEKFEQAKAREEITMIRSREIAQDLGLDMKIGDVEYQGDGNKAIFYYIADERVDFRELIKLLATEFRVKVEMKQIGARQEAGRIGGIGPCGRQLCCSGWLTNFVSVSTSAARIQELSINPQKLAGQCAKLKCCLNYEVDAYIEAQRKLPSREIVLETVEGLYFHFKTDIFSEMMTYSLGRNSLSNLLTVHKDRVYEIIGLNKKGLKPDRFLSEIEENIKPKDVYGGNSLNEDSITRFDGSDQNKTQKKRKNSSSRRKTKNNPNNNLGPAEDGK
ncbi:MAG: PSP1 domain-containing protein [Candidatus Saccharimonadaceae bacterium]